MTVKGVIKMILKCFRGNTPYVFTEVHITFV